MAQKMLLVIRREYGCTWIVKISSIICAIFELQSLSGLDKQFSKSIWFYHNMGLNTTQSIQNPTYIKLFFNDFDVSLIFFPWIWNVLIAYLVNRICGLKKMERWQNMIFQSFLKENEVAWLNGFVLKHFER